MQNHLKYLLILTVLIGSFSIYNYIIYTSKTAYQTVHLTEKAIKGENIWLQHNCSSCHQIYGLGGYLGPDITNVYSREGKGEKYIKAIVNSGIKTMPQFNFSEEEKDQLVQFFKEIDQTGYYPDVNAKISKDGWVTIKNKQHENGK
ncbi:cytochrome c [Flavobacterium sp.]|uniref:c-type cytochrome n=1 Tax=Flavobacterium sp. TaxID=239 RepID=UPI00262F5647|nr:cytochrome c [Flavobacterium sp.]MDD2985312.1 cytochrome c [Flavobacterium sp.]